MGVMNAEVKAKIRVGCQNSYSVVSEKVSQGKCQDIPSCLGDTDGRF